VQCTEEVVSNINVHICIISYILDQNHGSIQPAVGPAVGRRRSLANRIRRGGTCNFSCSEKYAKLNTIRVPACGMFSDPNVHFIVISKLIKHGSAKKDISWRLVSSLKNV